MSNLVSFNFNSNSVRVVDVKGEPWFVAKDVCTCLDLPDTSKAIERLDDDEKGTNSILTLGGKQAMSIVSESGLYSLALTSRKPEAKTFKRWITHEVLPSIRKTGSYAKPNSVYDEANSALSFYANLMDIAGIIGNEKTLACNQAVTNATGVNGLADTGQLHLLAPVQEQLLTVTDIGKRIGASARATNELLTSANLQVAKRDLKGRLYYELTKEGLRYGTYLDTGKRHSDGTPIKQIKWFSSVEDKL